MTLYDQLFLFLNQQAGWRALQPPDGLELAAEIQLQSLPGEGRPLADESGNFGGLALPTALALDCQGRIYVLDGDSLWRYDRCAGYWQKLPHIGGNGSAPRRFRRPRGLAISRRNDLYVADSGNRRVQVFTVKGLALRAIWGPLRIVEVAGERRVQTVPNPCPDPCDDAVGIDFPAGTWRPWDVAIAPNLWAYVSDEANGLIHLFDSRGCWRAAWDGADEEGAALERPTHLALDRQGHLYVVQAGRPDVVVLDRDGRYLRRVEQPTEVGEHFAPAAIGFDPEGRLYLSDARTGCVYVYDQGQQTARRCHDFRGRGCAIAFDDEGRPLLADKVSGLVFELRQDTARAASGSVIIGPLDSEIYRCQWHRVLLEGRIAPGTCVDVETFASDAPRQAEQIASLPDERWATRQRWARPGDGPWDCLIASPPGRYLWLRLSFHGDQKQTPALRTIHVDYPRTTSLQHLPSVYRQDPVSADFLDRFLAIADAVFGTVADAADRMAWYFDPEWTPAERTKAGETDFLSWLASWLGLALEQEWPEAVRRRLVEQAHRLYALRGTPAGLRRHVALVTGVEPQILEHHRLRRWLFLNQARLGDAAVLWGANIVDRLQLDVHAEIGDFQLLDAGDPLRDPFHTYAHTFTIFVPLGHNGEREQQMVESIVEMAKPAHTAGTVTAVMPRMCIGSQSVVGVNTVIAAYPAGVSLEGGPGDGAGSRLGDGTLLSPSEDEAEPPRMRIGKQTRIGSDTLIN